MVVLFRRQMGTYSNPFLLIAAAGISDVFSNITPYSAPIRNGEAGLLVNNTADAWFHGIEHFLANPEAASDMTSSTWREVREHHPIGVLSGLYATVFNDLLGRKHVRRLFSGLPPLPARLDANAYRFLNRHLLWRELIDV